MLWRSKHAAKKRVDAICGLRRSVDAACDLFLPRRQLLPIGVCLIYVAINITLKRLQRAFIPAEVKLAFVKNECARIAEIR